MTKHHGCERYGNRWNSFIALILLAVSLEQFAARLAAADGDDFAAQSQKQWHQWRGPLATGVAPFGNPPVEWSETKHVKWKVEAPGRGGSTPIVWNGKIYLATAVNSGRVIETAAKPEDQPERPFGIKYPNTVYQYQLLCFDLATGEKLWERTATEELPHEGHHGDNTFASSSPYVDGQSVYVSFGSRGLYCYSLDGDLRWKHPLPNVKTRLSFGEASSPVVARGRLVLVRDNEESSRILVLDAVTGELKWQADREEVSAWATPLVTEYQGRWQVVTNASARVRSYDLETGELIWECGGQVANVIPSPMRHGDNVICMSGYKGSAAFSLPLDARGNITDTDKIGWRYDRDTPYVPSALLYDNRLYFSKLNTAIFTMLDATTGQPIVAASRLQGVANVYASPVAAAGRVYIVGRDGSAVVLKQGDELQTLATNKLDDGIDASPAIIGNSLLLRGHKYLYHIAE
jgi:outer membrane protein assembly factor BamB